MPVTTTYAPNAQSKSDATPLTRICAFDGISSPPAGMRPVGVTSSTSSRLQPAIAIVLSAPAIPSARMNERIVMCASESEVESDDPRSELRQRGLLPRGVAAARAAEEHRFGLEPDEIRPHGEVASGDRDGRAARARHSHVALRDIIRERQLAPLRETGVGDEEVDQVAVGAGLGRPHG